MIHEIRQYEPDPEAYDDWQRASVPNGFRTCHGNVIELTLRQKKRKSHNRMKNKHASKMRRKQRG